MSSAPQKSTGRLRTVPAAVAVGLAGLVTALALAGCSSGQDTQTDSVEPAVNGSQGNIGPIGIRDAKIAYPQGGAYPAGGSAPLVLTIVNSGPFGDELVEVTSDSAGSARVSGDRMLLPGRSIQVGTPGATISPSATRSATPTVTTTTAVSPTSGSVPPSSPSGSPSARASSSSAPAAEPVELGKATIVLSGLNNALAAGRTYAVTFVFRNAGSITLQLPIATPTTARPEPTSSQSHG